MLLLAPLLAARAATVEEHPAYQSGLRALHDELPDLAIPRFEEALAAFPEDEPARRLVHLRLGEASARAAKAVPDPEASRTHALTALDHLSATGLDANDPARFWAAHACLALGRLDEAAQHLSALHDSSNPSLRIPALLTHARLQAALGRHQNALDLLEQLQNHPDQEVAAEANFLQASLHLELGNLDHAEILLAGELANTVTASNPHFRYLQAQLSLARERFANAAALFSGLAAHPGNLELPLHHGAIIGEADALHALGRTEKATSLLLSFLDENPRTPLLPNAFQRLAQWSASAETLRTRFEDHLRSWSGTPPLSAWREKPPATTPLELRQLGDVVAMAAAVDPTPEPEISAFALFHHARLLARKNDPRSVDLARFLLARLRLEHPAHPLAETSLLETARLHNARGHPEKALAALDSLERLSPSPDVRAAAAKLAGYVRFRKQDYRESADAFARAAASMEPERAPPVRANQAIGLLLSGASGKFQSLLDNLDDRSTVAALKLERILLDAAAGHDVRPALDRFLRRNPSHPRAAEARLALAELSLAAASPDLSMARAQLESIDPARLTARDALRHLKARLRMGELAGDWSGAIAAANRYLARRDAGGIAPAVRIKLGEAYYRNGDFNKARLLFLDAAAEANKESLREVALFMASKAALKVLTDKSRDEAVTLLRRVAAGNGLLAGEARLHLARALIQTDPRKALEALEPMIAGDRTAPEQVDALVLAAEAHRALGGDDQYRTAIAIYDRLLARPSLPYPLSNRLHSLRGQAFELLHEPSAALDSYYRVINRENLPPDKTQNEWFWFYDCGFNALRVLETGQRWHSALEVARKLAASGGPRAPEAAKRARAIQLEHMIWDD